MTQNITWFNLFDHLNLAYASNITIMKQIRVTFR